MDLFTAFLISLAFTVAAELLRPKPSFDKPKPSSLGDFQFPTADETRTIPVVYGTVRIKGPNVVWWGDLTAKPIKKKVKTGLFSSDTIIQGYQYHLGMQCVLSWGTVDEFLGIQFDGKDVTLTGTTTSADLVTFTMNSPTLLSTDDPKNGITGPVKLYMGTFNQTQNAYLASKFGEYQIPAYRGVCYAVFEKCYLGNNDSVPPVTFTVRRTPNPLGLTGGKHNISGDANPMNIIYEMMTNTFWGAGIPAAMIDTVSFVAAANTLADEGLGLSMQIDRASSLESQIEEIGRHIGGVVYYEPTTGKWAASLARDDYNIATIPQLDESNIEGDSFSFSRGSWEETRNTVKVKYIDRSQDYTERMVQHQNLANVSVRGGQVDMEEIDFSGISNSTAANVVAARALKSLSSPLSKVELEVNRTQYSLRPGSVFKLSWSQLGISQVVYRVVDIDYGTLDRPTIKIKAVEDIFSVEFASYIDLPNSGWENPLNQAVSPAARSSVFEAPYAFQDTPSADRYVLTSASSSREGDIGYRVYQDADGGTTYVQTTTNNFSFTPSALLQSELSAAGTPSGINLSLYGGFHMEDVAVPSASDAANGLAVARIVSTAGEELISYTGITSPSTGNWTLSGVTRAIYDTVPLTHPAGATVWFISEATGYAQDTPYSNDTVMDLKLLPYNQRNELSLASAPNINFTRSQRASRPYPPGSLLINSVYRPSIISGELVLSWVHRDRLTQGRAPTSQLAASVGPESGVTYTVRLYDETGALKRTATGLTGTTYTWSTEMDDCNLVDTQPGAQESTVSLLHFDGNYNDDTGRAWQVIGNALLSTAQSRFGSASLQVESYSGLLRSSSLVLGTGNFTVEFWIRPTTASNSLWTIFDTRNASSTEAGTFYIVMSSNNDVTLYYCNASSATLQASSAYNSTPINNWHHVAVVRSGNSLTLYVNGVGSTPITINTGTCNYPFMRLGGSFRDGLDRGLAGFIDEFRISRSAVYTANFTPPTVPFTLGSEPAAAPIRGNITNYYPLNELSGTTFRDYEQATRRDAVVFNSTVTLAQPTIRSGGNSSIALSGAGTVCTSTWPEELFRSRSHSMQAWVRFTAWSATRNTICICTVFGSTSQENYFLYVYVDSNRRLVVEHERAAGVVITTTASNMTPLALNTNYHIVVTKDAGPFDAVDCLLRFDGTEGSTTFTCETGRTVTRVGSPTITTAESRFGGSSGRFPNTGGDCIRVDNVFVNRVGSPGGNYCIEGWAKREDTAADYGLFTLSGSSAVTGTVGLGLHLTAANGWVFTFNGSAQPAFTLNPGTGWFHWAVVVSSGGGVATLYINGTSVGGYSGSGWPSDANNGFLHVGVRTGATPLYWKGWIDSVRVHENSAVYNGTFTPPTQPFPYVAGTRQYRFYVNGALVDTQPYSGEADPTNADVGQRLIIGQASTATPSASFVLNGRIQDFFVSTDVLTASEVSWLYNGGAGRSTVEVLGVAPRLSSRVRAEVESVRGGLASFTDQDWTVTRAGQVTNVVLPGNFGFTGDIPATGATGGSVATQFQAFGVSGTPVWTLDSPPSGAAISGSGAFSWTPTAAGTYTIAVRLTDFPSMAAATRTFTVTVAASLPGANGFSGSMMSGYAGVPYLAVASTEAASSESIVVSLSNPYTQWRCKTEGLPDGVTQGSNSLLTFVGCPTTAGTWNVSLTGAPFGNISGGSYTTTMTVLPQPSFTVFNPFDRQLGSNQVKFANTANPLLTVYTNAGQDGIARAVNGITASDTPRYWEVTLDDLPTAGNVYDFGVGLSASNSMQSRLSGIGSIPGEWGYRLCDLTGSSPRGSIVSNTSETVIGIPVITEGTTLRFATRNTGTQLRMWIAVENGPWIGGGDPVTNTTPTFDVMSVPSPSMWGDFRPAIWLRGAIRATANFGSQPWKYTPPAPAAFSGIPYSAPANTTTENVWDTDRASIRGSFFSAFADDYTPSPLGWARTFGFFDPNPTSSILAMAPKSTGKWQFEVVSPGQYTNGAYIGLVPFDWNNKAAAEGAPPAPGRTMDSFGVLLATGTGIGGSAAGQVWNANANVGTMTQTGANVVLTFSCDFDAGTVAVRRAGTLVGTYNLPPTGKPWVICGAGVQWSSFRLITRSLTHPQAGFNNWILDNSTAFGPTRQVVVTNAGFELGNFGWAVDTAYRGAAPPVSPGFVITNTPGRTGNWLMRWQGSPGGAGDKCVNVKVAKTPPGSTYNATVWVRCNSFSAASATTVQAGIMMERFEDEACTIPLGSTVSEWALFTAVDTTWRQLQTFITSGGYIRVSLIVTQGVNVAVTAQIDFDDIVFNGDEYV